MVGVMDGFTSRAQSYPELRNVKTAPIISTQSSMLYGIVLGIVPRLRRGGKILRMDVFHPHECVRLFSEVASINIREDAV